MTARTNLAARRSGWRTIGTAVLIFACAQLGLPAGLAQAGSDEPQDEPPRGAERGRRWGRGDRERGRRGLERGGPERGRGMMIGGGLFRPSPEDFAPLTDEERDELMAFLEEHLSSLHTALENLRDSDSVAFEQKMEEAAPRLRQLRRIFERDPELGQRVLEHSENMRRMRRGWRAWRGAKDDQEKREKLWTQIRRMAAQNLRIELQVMEDRVREIEEQRDERIAADVERLLSDEVLSAGEPERVREIIDQYHAAETDEQRAEQRAKLEEFCGKRIDREVTSLRERIQQMRQDASAEVDRRMERWSKHGPAERGRRGEGGPPKGEGRGRRPPPGEGGE